MNQVFEKGQIILATHPPISWSWVAINPVVIIVKDTCGDTEYIRNSIPFRNVEFSSITNKAEDFTRVVSQKYPDRKIFVIDTNGDLTEFIHENGRFIKFGDTWGTGQWENDFRQIL